MVVLAVGITSYAYTPPELARLGPGRVAHTSRCNDGGALPREEGDGDRRGGVGDGHGGIPA